MTMTDLIGFLYVHRAPALPAGTLADLFDCMIWCCAEEQATCLLQVREDWLRSAERARVEIALAMDEVYPFDTGDEMERVFAEIEERWPEFAGRCEELRHSRRAIEE